MESLLVHVLAWPTFGVAVLVFGFAPGAVLRVIVLAFRRDDSRRKELIAELYKVPRIERPFWVAEQLEIALSEGLRGRLTSRNGEARKKKKKKKKDISNEIVGPQVQELMTPARDMLTALEMKNPEKNYGAAAHKVATIFISDDGSTT